ncbi:MULTISPECIES: autoinducer binding domain-containing protein [unclassified Roseovarius]|jgi:DNA-binding CsgD family transcriptional regulator|uniref:autoinducer binding domain-containing protein n=1 Tax=unclassified Roseovarius TaxID=2614913 RepID=UPI000068725F|nr:MULTISPECIES: autoinducer binding domain-containing protein [unclassified Roseovarius]EAQ23245.1 autoinducer-binding transcriptional regulator LuxR [Roseovarius sp. 217]KJS41702.1 MAG: LuxR family transcriptional regulator [Roseovarius sp. BRH_c41]
MAQTNPFRQFLDDLRDRFELDHVAYAGMNPISGASHGHMTYGEDWTAHYLQNKYYEIDPTLLKARHSIAPVDWHRLERGAEFQTIFRDARDFGISDRGLTIPIHGPYGDVGGLSINRDCSDREWHLLISEIIGDLQSAAVHMHDMVIQADPLTRMLNSPSLSTREIEILQWTAAGKSQQDIGDILSISHRTVEVHLRSARQKLNALTTPQAIGRAINLGLIYPR